MGLTLDTLMGRYTKAIGLMALMVLISTPAALCDEEGIPDAPNRPTEFSTAVDLKRYLTTLHHYMMTMSRVRLGKRADAYTDDGDAGKGGVDQPRQFSTDGDEVASEKMKRPSWIGFREVKDTRGVEHPSSYDPYIYRSNQRRYKNRKGRTLDEERGDVNNQSRESNSALTDSAAAGDDYNGQARRGVEHPGRNGNWMGRSMVEREEIPFYKTSSDRGLSSEERRGVEHPERYRYTPSFEERYLKNLCAYISKQEYPIFANEFAWRHNIDNGMAQQARAILTQICDWIDPPRTTYN